MLLFLSFFCRNFSYFIPAKLEYITMDLGKSRISKEIFDSRRDKLLVSKVYFHKKVALLINKATFCVLSLRRDFPISLRLSGQTSRLFSLLSPRRDSNSGPAD